MKHIKKIILLLLLLIPFVKVNANSISKISMDIYVDKDANQEIALDILENAKTSRPSVCNAAEVCLVHQDIAEEFLPRYYKRLVSERQEKGLTPVELRLDAIAGGIINGKAAGPEDFDTEFLNYIMGVKVVASAEEAIAHINKYNTGHSESIITKDDVNANKFLDGIDAACVYVNASTRFTDGFEFGFGAEIGISTQKLHARGPMGLLALTSYKYTIHGNGQVRK